MTKTVCDRCEEEAQQLTQMGRRSKPTCELDLAGIYHEVVELCPKCVVDLDRWLTAQHCRTPKPGGGSTARK